MQNMGNIWTHLQKLRKIFSQTTNSAILYLKQEELLNSPCSCKLLAW